MRVTIVDKMGKIKTVRVILETSCNNGLLGCPIVVDGRCDTGQAIGVGLQHLRQCNVDCPHYVWNGSSKPMTRPGDKVVIERLTEYSNTMPNVEENMDCPSNPALSALLVELGDEAVLRVLELAQVGQRDFQVASQSWADCDKVRGSNRTPPRSSIKSRRKKGRR